MRSWKVAAAAGAVALAGINAGIAATVWGGSSPAVRLTTQAGVTVTTLAPTTTTSTTVAPTTVPTTAPAPTTTVPVTTTTAPAPVQVGSPLPGVRYTIGGACPLNRSAKTVTCSVTVTASDGSTPVGQVVVGAPAPYSEAQLVGSSATVSVPWDGNATYATVGYRGGVNKSADAQIPLS